jgi:hypothetical protein
MSMNAAEMARAGFKRQRCAGIAAITAAMPVALLLWLAIVYLTPPLPGVASLGGRMLFTLKCCSLAVLFCLVTDVEAVAPKSEADQYPNDGRRHNRPHRGTIRRIGCEAEKPDCKRKDLLQCILRIALIDLSRRVSNPASGSKASIMHRSAAMRGIGAPGMALSPIVLLYVAGRIGWLGLADTKKFKRQRGNLPAPKGLPSAGYSIQDSVSADLVPSTHFPIIGLRAEASQ